MVQGYVDDESKKARYNAKPHVRNRTFAVPNNSLRTVRAAVAWRGVARAIARLSVDGSVSCPIAHTSLILSNSGWSLIGGPDLKTRAFGKKALRALKLEKISFQKVKNIPLLKLEAEPALK